MGVYSAANSMGLDFVPVGEEHYDFLVPVKLLEDERVKRFVEVLTSDEFKKRITKFGGYGLDGIGEITIIK